MTQEGRNWLVRIERRCAQAWGEALYEMEADAGCGLKPFGAVIWHDCLRILGRLKNGFSVKET